MKIREGAEAGEREEVEGTRGSLRFEFSFEVS